LIIAIARWSLIEAIFFFGGFFWLMIYNLQFREANEEVAFPLCSPHVHTLCTLEPFVSPNRVLVTPVIAFLDDISVLEDLRAAPGEVARIFDHSLEALLDPELLRDSEEKLVPLGSEDWPYETELHVSYPPAYFFSFFLFLFGAH
jgi:peroxisomal coenzyme A diphosphatase NUDT7